MSRGLGDVYKRQVFQAKEAKKLTAADEDINSLMVELIASHTLG